MFEPNQNESVETPEHEAVEPQVESGETPQGSEEESEAGTESATEQGSEEKLSPEQLRDALTKARNEAGSWRTKLRATEKQLTEMKSVEEVEALADQMRGEREEAERALIRENVALKFGLPEKLAALLKGDSREEIEQHAKDLQEFAPAQRNRGDAGGGLDPTADDDAFDPEALAKSTYKPRY